MRIATLKLEELGEIDETSSKVLNEIVKQFDGRESAWVEYTLIASNLGYERERVRKSVNRMKAKGIVIVKDKKLFIPSLVYVNTN